MKRPIKKDYLLIDNHNHKYIDKDGLETYVLALNSYIEKLEAINYTHCCKSDSELLIADFIEKYNKGLVGNERIHEDCLEDYLQGNL